MLNIFKKKKKPIYDPTLGDPFAKVILAEAKKGHFKTTLTELESLKQGNWDQRAFYIDLIGQYLNETHSLPDSPTANLIRGTFEIHQAWLARGRETADQVTTDGWRIFFARLQKARDFLLQAAEQEPDDPTPYAFLQTVAMGLQLDREYAQIWLNEATRRDPYNMQAHYRHLFLLCKKWGGSHDEMYAFAHATLDKTPVNLTLNTILFVAFQEHFFYLLGFDKNIEGAEAFIKNQKVRQESVTVYEKCLANRRKIEHVSDYWPHNVAAWWFYMLRMHKYVRQETKKIGPYFTEFPWSIMYRDPAEGYYLATKF